MQTRQARQLGDQDSSLAGPAIVFTGIPPAVRNSPIEAEWSQPGMTFAPAPGDIWQCLETFLVVTNGGGTLLASVGDRLGMLQNALQCLGHSLPRPTTNATKNYPASRVSCVAVKKLQ